MLQSKRSFLLAPKTKSFFLITNNRRYPIRHGLTMQTGGVYRTTVTAAAGQWAKALIMNRCMNSGPNLKNLNMVEDNVDLEEEEASLPKSKQRIRIDLGANSEQKSAVEVDNVINNHHLGPRQALLSHKSSYLPTRFGKKKKTMKKHRPISVYGKLHQSYHEFDTDNNFFDICIPHAATDAKKYKAFANDDKTMDNYWVHKVAQHKHSMEQCPVEDSGKILRPGMVLFKNYIRMCDQVEIVKKCRELGCGTGGFYRPGYNGGAKLHLQMMCLGLDWNAQTKKYGKIRQHDNAAPPDIPREFKVFVNRVIDDCHSLINKTTIDVDDVLPRMSPDVCIVNFYTTNGRLGLHQDRDESRESLTKGLPVVSISIGDSAEFLYGDERDIEKAESVILESGDVLIFGGESRHVFHGVPTIYPNTAPPTLQETSNIRPGRLNLTFRKF